MTTTTQRRKPKTFFVALLACAVALGVLGSRVFQRQRAEWAVRQSLGFNTSTPLINGRETIVLQVDPLSPMEQAGFKSGDRIQLRGAEQFYTMFIGKQGKTVTVPVRRSNGNRLSVSVKVPSLNP